MRSSLPSVEANNVEQDASTDNSLEREQTRLDLTRQFADESFEPRLVVRVDFLNCLRSGGISAGERLLGVVVSVVEEQREHGNYDYQDNETNADPHGVLLRLASCLYVDNLRVVFAFIIVLFFTSFRLTTATASGRIRMQLQHSVKWQTPQQRWSWCLQPWPPLTVLAHRRSGTGNRDRGAQSVPRQQGAHENDGDQSLDDYQRNLRDSEQTEECSQSATHTARICRVSKSELHRDHNVGREVSEERCHKHTW